MQTTWLLKFRYIFRAQYIILIIIILCPGATARINAAFGAGTGPLFLDDVKCIGLEYRLIDCPNRGIEVSGCTHSRDAGVVCVTGIYV